MGGLINAMLWLAAIIVFSVAVAVTLPQDKASRAEMHLRKACEIVWPDATESKLERCTDRAMAAMGDDERLRDNELKHLLVACERELEECKG